MRTMNANDPANSDRQSAAVTVDPKLMMQVCGGSQINSNTSFLNQRLNPNNTATNSAVNQQIIKPTVQHNHHHGSPALLSQGKDGHLPINLTQIKLPPSQVSIISGHQNMPF